MDLKGIVLFDIDGVIRDVGDSYRLAVKKTVLKFCDWQPSDREIDVLKAEGCWNNDWDASLELIKRHIDKRNISISPPNRNHLIKEFNNFYFGGDPFGDPKNWKGFINNEPLLVNQRLFTQLTKKNIKWGFFSGAEQSSAKYVLENRLGLSNPPLLAMGDAPEKPDPTGLIKIALDFLAKPLGQEMPSISYIGDTVADVLTIQKARKRYPAQRFISFAVAPPHLSNEKTCFERKAYEKQLIDAGADHILSSTNDILQYF